MIKIKKAGKPASESQRGAAANAESCPAVRAGELADARLHEGQAGSPNIQDQRKDRDSVHMVALGFTSKHGASPGTARLTLASVTNAPCCRFLL